jgi:hypothetical protein
MGVILIVCMVVYGYQNFIGKSETEMTGRSITILNGGKVVKIVSEGGAKLQINGGNVIQSGGSTKNYYMVCETSKGGSTRQGYLSSEVVKVILLEIEFDRHHSGASVQSESGKIIVINGTKYCVQFVKCPYRSTKAVLIEQV